MTKKAMEVVQAARDEKHISGHELRKVLFPDFFELHGDGLSGDDPAIVGGLATFHGQPVTIITTSRGHSLNERIEKHFGQPEPSGYRKACRLVENAAKFHRTVFLFVDLRLLIQVKVQKKMAKVKQLRKIFCVLAKLKHQLLP